jgi:predicted amidophosphoribosyltransferase
LVCGECSAQLFPQAPPMLHNLWCAGLALISSPRCPICAGCASEEAPLCQPCGAHLALPEGGLQGDEPLLWCALGSYAGPLRQLLLSQRPKPRPSLIAALAVHLHRCCAGALPPGCLLVPIPSWKRAANPLPQLLAAGLARASGRRLVPDLLQRRRATVGQHHLNRIQRLGNQRGSFACQAAAGGRAPVWLVDDILTTGATALAAAELLQHAGWPVQGLLCLARTPRGGARHDLRSASRQGDGPG